MAPDNIEVVILCGGAGTRLKEETESRPKPMIEIGDKPILWHIMKIYSACGFKDFILCLGYKGETIKNYFYNYEILRNDFTIELGNRSHIEIHSDCQEKDWRVTLADTGEKSLKGSRIRQIEKYVTGDLFMVTYGDGLADIDLAELLAFHKSHGRIGTVTGVRPPSRFGEILMKDNRVISFMEKPQVSVGLINGGFFVFNRKFFGYLTEDEDCDLERGALERLVADGELMVYEHKGDWECMDTLRDMQYLNRLWQNSQAFWKIWKE